MKRISLKTALESPGEYTLANEVYDAHNLIMKRGTPLTKPEIIILHKLGWSMKESRTLRPSSAR